VRVAITGKPRTGKTTLCFKLYESLKDEFDCGGFVTFEVRETRGGISRRIGFRFHDLSTGEEMWLARVDHASSVTVGKYGVFVENIDRVSEKIFEYSKKEVFILDEVGPMELKSRKFVESVDDVIENSNSVLIFTIHLKSNHWLLRKIRSTFDVIVIDENNRDAIAYELKERLKKLGV
jgi:nucleoside-triphosphatase